MTAPVGSSIPAALSYLSTHIEALDAVKAANAVVSDGWPARRSDAMVVLGLNPDRESTGVGWEYVCLGGDENEAVVLHNVVVVRRVGEHASVAARRAALDVLDGIRALVRTDRHCGGAISPGKAARLTRAVMAPTSTAQQAGEGRVVEIKWWLEWQHRLLG